MKKTITAAALVLGGTAVLLAFGFSRTLRASAGETAVFSSENLVKDAELTTASIERNGVTMTPTIHWVVRDGRNVRVLVLNLSGNGKGSLPFEFIYRGVSAVALDEGGVGSYLIEGWTRKVEFDTTVSRQIELQVVDDLTVNRTKGQDGLELFLCAVGERKMTRLLTWKNW